MKKSLLLTGASGQLGREFQSRSDYFPDFEFHFRDKSQLDISNSESIYQTFQEVNPQILINCAAYTQVDKAESDPETAFRINRDAVCKLAEACVQSGTRMIHFSTDYVYDSVTDRPILETDPLQPKSIYGRSKMEGEICLKKTQASFLIFRISWLYSSFGHNFVKSMLDMASCRESLNVVADQIGSPTHAGDLVRDVMNILSTQYQKIRWREEYNYSNEGHCSWHEFAKEIFSQAERDISVIPVSTKEFGAPAARPAWSVLSKSKFTEDFSIPLQNWKDSLKLCLQGMLS